MSSRASSPAAELLGTNQPPGLLEPDWLDGFAGCIRLRDSDQRTVDDAPPPHQVQLESPRLTKPNAAA